MTNYTNDEEIEYQWAGRSYTQLKYAKAARTNLTRRIERWNPQRALTLRNSKITKRRVAYSEWVVAE